MATPKGPRARFGRPAQVPLAIGPPVKPDAEGNLTFDGEVSKIAFSNDETGFRVIRVKREEESAERTVIGVFPLPLVGSRIRATGKWMRDPKRGEQLKATAVLPIGGDTLVGVEKFLGSGVIPGIGPALAKRIVTAFGDQTFEVLDTKPERLREVNGLGPGRLATIRKAWEAHRVISAIMIFLQAHGASPALATRIWKRFGQKAVSIVSQSPYRLALDVWGVGFKTADRIAASLGIDRNSPERAQAGVLHILHEQSSSGHTYVPPSELAEAAAAMLEIDQTIAETAIESLRTDGRAIVDPREGWVFLPRLFEAESIIAEHLARLISAEAPLYRTGVDVPARAIEKFEAATKVTLAPLQREAVLLAAHQKVVVITGGPGVGKTTIVRAVLECFSLAGVETRLAAPTGRAAKRMAEATAREAVTLHRLLEFDPKERSFKRNEDEPLELGALIIDECSMVDVELMAAVVQAVPKSARLILVGDVDQLPSVGPGAVLRDIIQSGVVGTARLSAIFRQAEGSLIVENAHRIHGGEPPHSSASQNGDFYVIERRSDEEAASSVIELVTSRIPKRFGFDPVRDIQVLTPMHRGPSGTTALNERLQTALNPSGPSVRVGHRLFRLGDKVMQLRNDYEREIYNGDVGVICRIDEEERTLALRVDDREITYEEHDLEELSLAYASSIHKSQGSEYAAVVIPFTMNHFVMLSRNLLYTAVTRGKKLVVLVGDPRAIKLSLAEIRKERRMTALATRLAEALG